MNSEIDAAGATGRGEAVIQNCGALAAVQAIAAGLNPTDACLSVLKRIVDDTKQTRLRGSDGRPNFNVAMYALGRDGA